MAHRGKEKLFTTFLEDAGIPAARRRAALGALDGNVAFSRKSRSGHVMRGNALWMARSLTVAQAYSWCVDAPGSCISRPRTSAELRAELRDLGNPFRILGGGKTPLFGAAAALRM